MTTTEMHVHMDCAGCENKIRKALQKVKGVEDVDIDMGLQKVTVTGWAEQKKILKTVRRTGRRAELRQFPFNPQLRNNNYVGLAHQYQPYNTSTSTYYNTAPPASSYNYYKHGYDSHVTTSSLYRGNSGIFGNKTGDAFSDENSTGCSIM